MTGPLNRGSPNKTIRPPIANGPKTIPAIISPMTSGSLKRLKISENIFELGGPQIFSFKELMKILLKQIKKKRFLVPIPIPFAKVLGRILQVMPKPLLTADQVELMQYDSVVSNKYPTLKDLKINPKTINEVLPSYIWRHRQGGQFSKL